MRSLSMTDSAPRDQGQERQEQKQTEQTRLLFRNVALLYPWKGVLDRIRRGGNADAPVPQFISSMFDEDNEKQSPLADKEDIRILLAQDDTGVSLNRLLFDSKHAKDVSGIDTGTATDGSRQHLRISSFSRLPSYAENSRSSGFIRNQSNAKESRKHPVPGSTYAKPDIAGAPSSPSGSFGQSTHIRRMPAYVSLADARKDAQMPIEDTKEETDSWLDCVFGKSPMKYKGNNTKIHVLQRQPLDPKLAHWEKESRRGGFELCPQRNAPLPKSRPDEMISLRKPAILVSQTFTIPIQNGDASDQFRCITPAFAVALLLPLVKEQDGGEAVECQVQLTLDNWHTILRALDALQAAASIQISRRLQDEVDIMSKRYTDGLLPTSRLLRLKPCALQDSVRVAKLARTITSRIARSFRILAVETRNEWNIWRDELRDTNRSGKGTASTRATFVQLALTGSLSSNLSWVRVFAPPHLQTRLQREAREADDTYDEAQNRTIVITADHNKARQLIYILSKFMPIAQTSTEFVRSSTNVRASSHVSALTQGLKAVNQNVDHPRDDPEVSRGPFSTFGAPIFEPPAQVSMSTSPAKHASNMSTPKASSPNKANLHRKKSRLDIQGKGTPAMPISSAPGSSYTTPAASPEARPGSSGGAQGDLLRHLQRNNSALSETSTESGSFWNSFRSSSWTWGLRRESGATSVSEGGPDTSALQRGDALTGILKTGKTSIGRNGGKKLVRMVEEIEEMRVPHDDINGRIDSAIPTPTTHTDCASQIGIPMSFSQMLEYTYNATESVVDIQLLGERSGSKTCKVPVSDSQFPLTHHNKDASLPPQHSPAKHAAYDKVAGYLEHMHPDFALQAVKPYKCLEDDIKQSMQGERSPKQGCGVAESQFFPLERWVDVCSTIVIDADAMSVKRITLRRHIRYSLTAIPDEVPSTKTAATSFTTIKITKSEDMDDVKRTYRRDDEGTKVAWKDKRIVPSAGGSPGSSGEASMINSIEQLEIVPVKPNSGHSTVAIRKPETWRPEVTISSNGQFKQEHHLGDDLTAFIDEHAKKSHKAKSQPPITATRSIPTRDREGKITGWKDIDVDEPEETGLHDLPSSFLNPRRERVKPAIHERTLEEVFEEEFITKPDQSIVSLLEQMLASSENRSAVPSRAGSVHGRTHSRSNSITGGSGLTELQFESKKIVEDTLEELVTSVASDKHSPSRPTGRFFGLRRGGAEAPDGSILRQSISKWLSGR